MKARSDADVRDVEAVAELAQLDAADARLVAFSSRAVWHLPRAGAAVVIPRPGARSPGQVHAESRAVRAAVLAGVLTPRLLCGPVALPDARVALVFEWVNSRAIPSDRAWPLVVVQAAQLASAPTTGLPTLRTSFSMSTPTAPSVLGTDQAADFTARWSAASEIVAALSGSAPLVVCHGDLQLANMLIDRAGRGWLIDFEYACLAPPEWDPAKVLILARRFGDPADPEVLLGAWPALDPARLAACVTAQEILNVGWLIQMAERGTTGASVEARRRAKSLGRGGWPPWSHLR